MILQMAQGSIGCEAGPAVKFEAELMVEGLRQIRLMIEDTDKQIQDLCREFPEYEYLLSIPGFGPDVSSKVLGAVGDPFRFQNGKQVLKMAQNRPFWCSNMFHKYETAAGLQNPVDLL